MNNQSKYFIYALIIVAIIVITEGINDLEAQTSTGPIIKYAQESAFPINNRLNTLENQISSLNRKIEKPPKDIWDRINSISGLILGFIIACIGGIATYLYRKKQIAVLHVQIVKDFLPHLQSENDKEVEVALLAIAALGNLDLAAKIATLYPTKGTIGALSKITVSANPHLAQQARRSLKPILNYVESESLRKLRLICKDEPNPDNEILENIFFEGPEYGCNVTRVESSHMLKKGWIKQLPNNNFIITQQGRKLACQKDLLKS